MIKKVFKNRKIIIIFWRFLYCILEEPKEKLLNAPTRGLLGICSCCCICNGTLPNNEEPKEALDVAKTGRGWFGAAEKLELVLRYAKELGASGARSFLL